MQIGIVSDIHGNEPALTAVLNDMPGVDTIVSLGDVVGYGPHPRETASKIQNVASISLRGNHETYLENPEHAAGNDGAYKGIQHARDELTDELLDWLTTRPYHSVVADDVGVAHGHPDPDTPFKYVKPSNITELIPILSGKDYMIQAVGHSHNQFKQDLTKFDEESGVVFNPGSVGQPRDKDPRAGYAVIDTTDIQDNPADAVTLHRAEYDVDAAIKAITENGLPRESGTRLKNGQYPRNTNHRRQNTPFR